MHSVVRCALVSAIFRLLPDFLIFFSVEKAIMDVLTLKEAQNQG